MTLPMSLDSAAAVKRYQEIRSRLPNATHPETSRHVNNLTDLMDDIDVFILDGFGVLNVGEDVVPGAVEHVQELQRHGKTVKVITNGAGKPVEQTFGKYENWGFDFQLEDVISSRDALAEELTTRKPDFLWGFMAPGFSEIERLAPKSVFLLDDKNLYDQVDGFVLLSTGEWNTQRHELMRASLAARSRPVLVGNPDLVAPHAAGFSVEPGLFAHDLADACDAEPLFYGKPFIDVFTMMEKRLTVSDKKRIAMVGDTLHTDILGGALAGWSTVLITDHGLLKGLDVEEAINTSGIRPDFIASTT